MARGDVVVFNESKAYLLEAGWEPTDKWRPEPLPQPRKQKKKRQWRYA